MPAVRGDTGELAEAGGAVVHVAIEQAKQGVTIIKKAQSVAD